MELSEAVKDGAMEVKSVSRKLSVQLIGRHRAGRWLSIGTASMGRCERKAA